MPIVELQTQFGIDQHLVGMGYLRKPASGLRIIRILVRMPNLCELPVGTLNIGGFRRRIDAEHRVRTTHVTSPYGLIEEP